MKEKLKLKGKISEWAKTQKGAQTLLPGKRKSRTVAHNVGLTPYSGQHINEKTKKEKMQKAHIHMKEHAK